MIETYLKNTKEIQNQMLANKDITKKIYESKNLIDLNASHKSTTNAHDKSKEKCLKSD